MTGGSAACHSFYLYGVKHLTGNYIRNNSDNARMSPKKGRMFFPREAQLSFEIPASLDGEYRIS
jgi:hypothetical protein